MKIETKRLLITYAKMSDLDDIFDYVSNKDVMTYEREDFPTKESYEPALKYMTNKKVLFAVRIKGNDKVIGHIYLGKTNPECNNEYNLGYIFHPLFQRKGYCTEAAKVIVDYAFHSLHANRIFAACNPENIPSWKVMENVGLKKEGLFKKRFYWKNDDNQQPIYTDQLVYGLHFSDWKQSI